MFSHCLFKKINKKKLKPPTPPPPLPTLHHQAAVSVPCPGRGGARPAGGLPHLGAPPPRPPRPPPGQSVTHSLPHKIGVARSLSSFFSLWGLCFIVIFGRLQVSRSSFKKKSNDDDGGDRCRSPSPHHPTHTHTHTRKKTKLTTGPAAAADGDGHDGSGGVGGPRPAGL